MPYYPKLRFDWEDLIFSLTKNNVLVASVPVSTTKAAVCWQPRSVVLLLHLSNRTMRKYGMNTTDPINDLCYPQIDN